MTDPLVKVEPFEFTQYLSFLDLEYHPDWKEAWDTQNKELFEKVLHEMGADLSTGFEVTVILHRSRFSQKVEYGPRITFKERTDKYWMQNGMAVEDMVRNTTSEIARVGCILALNTERKMDEIQKAKLASQVTNIEIQVDMGGDV